MSLRKLPCSCPTPQALEGPVLSQLPEESPRDEDATALSALAATSAQRPGACTSLMPGRLLPSRTKICE